MRCAHGAANCARLIGDDRPVLVAASTRDGEEALVLDALARHRTALPPHCVVIVVPRHPQRFDAVASLLRERGVAFARRSDGLPLPRDATFVLGDSMGEMFAYYAAADVAFVGGSLLPLGGQNLIEPIAAGTPILVGPHTFNFAEAAEAAVAAGAALRVGDAAGMLAAAGQLLADRAARERMRSDGAGLPAQASRRSRPAVGLARAADRPPGCRTRRAALLNALQPCRPAVDVLQVVDRERPDGLLELQHAEQVVEVRLREVAPRWNTFCCVFSTSRFVRTPTSCPVLFES